MVKRKQIRHGPINPQLLAKIEAWDLKPPKYEFECENLITYVERGLNGNAHLTRDERITLLRIEQGRWEEKIAIYKDRKVRVISVGPRVPVIEAPKNSKPLSPFVARVTWKSTGKSGGVDTQIIDLSLLSSEDQPKSP